MFKGYPAFSKTQSLDSAVMKTKTVAKLYYFDKCIKSIYQKYGHTTIPFDGTKIQYIIAESGKDIVLLFDKIWGTSMGYLLLGKFYEFRGNVYEFFMNLDSDNRELFISKNW